MKINLYNYLNPCSQAQSESREHFCLLNTRCTQIEIIVATALAAIATFWLVGWGGVVVFKLLTDHAWTKQSSDSTLANQIVTEISEENFESFHLNKKSLIQTEEGSSNEKIKYVIDQPLIKENGLDEKKENSIVRYKKGEIRTMTLVPTSNELGTGSFSTVYDLDLDKLKESNPQSDLLKINRPLAVKKGSGENAVEDNELLMGEKLNHKNIAKSYKMFVKEESNGTLIRKKIVIEKVFGKVLYNYMNSPYNRLDYDVVKKNIQITKEVALYLFDEGVYWGRDVVNPKNMLIENDSNNLKFIDFGFWQEEKDVEKRAFCLLVSGIILVSRLLESSKFPKNFVEFKKNNFAISRILFPMDFIKSTFKSQDNYFLMESIKERKNADVDKDDLMTKPYWEKIQQCNKNTSEIKKYISFYFDSVLSQLEQEKSNEQWTPSKN